MELTKEQLLQIDNYVFVSGIKYYDVRTEIVDHFANILEQKLDKNPDLDFKREIENIHKNFSHAGFSILLKEKTKKVQNRFYKQSFQYFVTFFKLPKVILAAALFYILFLGMNWFENKETFFNILTSIGFLYIVIYFFSLFVDNTRDVTKKETFLTLDLNNSFFQVAHLGVIIFNSITTYRNNASFDIALYNNLQLAVFVLFILFLWSADYIYRKNKKQVQQQYPNVFI
ncbi:hypothetical protein [uncultured Polaribacter sp.]|uniref:hypothetical protein n=1 Tax=uncultured Polaribacter sp. TaxID=174711 RepID=UPI00262F05D0|nr:hypothetical protein [uncultured Polaribacter sp.]